MFNQKPAEADRLLAGTTLLIAIAGIAAMASDLQKLGGLLMFAVVMITTFRLAIAAPVDPMELIRKLSASTAGDMADAREIVSRALWSYQQEKTDWTKAPEAGDADRVQRRLCDDQAAAILEALTDGGMQVTRFKELRPR
jgi:hypothetical protein